MATVPPMHATDEDVYHNNSDCPLYRSLHEEKKRSGTGNRYLCEICRRLNRAGSDAQR